MHDVVRALGESPDGAEVVGEHVSESISHAPYRHQARVKLRGSAEALAAQVAPWCGVLEPLDDRSCVLRLNAT